MFISAKRYASVKADTMTWTQCDASVMQKFIVLADVAAPSVANALNTVAVAVTHVSAPRSTTVQ